MSGTIDTVKSTAALVESVLKHFSDSHLPANLRPAITDIISMFHTAMQIDILNILLPIVRRLRERIKGGDVKFFASDEFVTKVTAAVKLRCEEVHIKGGMPDKALKQVEPKMKPILLSIQYEAQMYQRGDQAPFESFMELANNLLTLLDQNEQNKQ